MYNKEMESIIKLQPAKRTRLSQGITKQLKEQIYDGIIKPGDRLPSMDVLSGVFKVGKPVVREAIQSLENSGLIFVKPGAGGGAFVKKVGTRVLSEAFEGIIRLDNVSMEELTDARLTVEMAMLPSIIDRIQPAVLEALEENIKKAEASLANSVKDSTNIQFHIILARVNNNRLMLNIIEAFSDLGWRFNEANEYDYERYKKIVQDHKVLIGLLKAKKRDKFLEMFEKHIKNSAYFFE